METEALLAEAARCIAASRQTHTASSAQTCSENLLAVYERLQAPEHAQHARTRPLLDALLQACEGLEGSRSDPPPVEASPDAPAPVLSAATQDHGNEASAWEMLADTGTTFADVVGATDAVQAIREAMVFPFRFPALYARMRLRAWRTILLFGPPGTGKSLLARAAATEIDAVFFNVSCADVTSKWVGGSEKLIKTLFADACARAPAVIFFDEIDSIARVRRSDTNVADQRLTNQLLLELDRIQHSGAGVSVLAATNLPWEIDSAALRRFAKQILVPLPSADARAHLFQRLFAKHELVFEEGDMQAFVQRTEHYSGADIATLVHECSFHPLRTLLAAHWFEAEECGDGNENDNEAAVRLHALTESTPDAYEASLEQVLEEYGEDALVLPPVSPEVVFAAIARMRPSVSSEVRFRYAEYLARLP